MSLQARCSHAFSPAVRSRGQSYARLGQVSRVQVTGDRATAVAFGSEVYQLDLSLERDTGQLWLCCTCPYAEGDLCKHLWAFLLVLDHKAAGRLEPQGARPIDVCLGDGDLIRLDGDEDLEEDDDWAASNAAGRVRAGAPSTTRSTSRRDAMRAGRRREAGRPALTWRQRMSSLALLPGRPAPAAEPQAELELRLDVDASRQQGVLLVRFFLRRPRTDGNAGAARAARLSRASAEKLLRADDRRVIALLLACGRSAETSSYWPAHASDRYIEASSVSLVEGTFDAVLPLVCASGRFGLVGDDGALVPLAWDGDRPFRLVLEIERSEAGRLGARGVLRREGEIIPVEQARLAHVGGAVVLDDRIIMVEEERAARTLVVALRADGAIEAREREAGAMLEALAAAAGPDALAFSPDLDIVAERGHPAARVAFEQPDRRSGHIPVCIDFGYGDWRAAASGGRSDDGDLGTGDEVAPAAWMAADGRTLTLRDPGGEAEALARIAAAGVARPRPGARTASGRPPDGEVDASEFPAVVSRLLEAGVEVLARGARIRSGGKAALRVRSGIDWFNLEADLHFDGARADLPALLRALRAGEGLVPLGDGTFGLIPEAWLARFGIYTRLGRERDDAVRFPRAQAALLDALLEREPEARVDAPFEKLRRRLRAHTAVEPRRAPRGFRGQLRAYQELGLGWLRFLEELGLGGCLADDMGLGKTVQVLVHLAGRRTRRRKAGEPDRPALVVVPRTLLFNWEAEAARFTPGLAVMVHHGAARRDRREQLGAADLVLTTYGTLVRDIDFFQKLELDYAVLDEAQAMKNPASRTAKACRLLRARHRLALTGTPVENRLADLGSIFEFLNPGMIDAASVLAPLTAADAGEEGLALVARALRPFLLRRTKEEVLPELPAKVEQTVACELDGVQRRLYQELRDHYRAALMERVEKQGLARSKIHVLEALLRLRQAACHPGLIDRGRVGEPSAKLDALIERIVEVVAAGHKALVFSQFTSFLALARHRLERAEIVHEYLDGKTRDRAARVARFQGDPDCRVFLLSLKAAGHGLNLTAADYVFLLDPWWNPAVEAQAVDRAHRIGQQRRVFTYRLIARDTVEEKVLALQSTKRRLAEAVVQRDPGLLGQLSTRDLELLLE